MDESVRYEDTGEYIYVWEPRSQDGKIKQYIINREMEGNFGSEIFLIKLLEVSNMSYEELAEAFPSIPVFGLDAQCYKNAMRRGIRKGYKYISRKRFYYRKTWVKEKIDFKILKGGTIWFQ